MTHMEGVTTIVLTDHMMLTFYSLLNIQPIHIHFKLTLLDSEHKACSSCHCSSSQPPQGHTYNNGSLCNNYMARPSCPQKYPN